MAACSLYILAICMVSVSLIKSTVSMKMSTLSNSRRFVFGWRRQNSSSSSCMIHHHPSSALFISPPSSDKTNKIYQKNAYVYQRQITPISSIRKTRSLLQMTPPSSASTSTQEGFNISIEYCSSCRWMLRSNWILSELLTTFANEDKLVSVSLIPQSPPLSDGGIFRICASNSDVEGGDINDSDEEKIVLWDRKVSGRFPESKEVKQLVRDVCNPDIDLGHSDVAKVDNNIANSKEEADDCIECKEEQENEQKSIQKSTKAEDQTNTQQQQQHQIPDAFYEQNQISIEYSVGSSIESPDNGLYQATYYTNEILSMIYERNVWWKKKQQEKNSNDDDDIPAAVDRVTVIPNRRESGILRIRLNDDKVLFDQLSDEDSAVSSIMSGRHLRDIVSTAIVDNEDNSSNETVFEMMSDDEAEEARKHFGVF